MYNLAVLLCKIWFGLVYKIIIVSAKNVPTSGAAILCPNHRGQLDMFLMAYRLKRKVHYMAKEELFGNFITNAFFKSLGAFPVKRGKADLGSFKAVYKLLSEGKVVSIFPEGTRIKKHDKGKVKVKSGAVLISAHSGADIIPVSISGSYRPFSKITITYGEPFKPFSNMEQGRKLKSEELEAASKELMDRIYAKVEE